MPTAEAGGIANGFADAGTDKAPHRTNWPHITVALLCLVAFVYMEIVAISEWMAGVWYLSDVGNIHYVMTNTWSGNFMYSASEGGNFFAFHFTPILFLLMPLVWLSDYPIPLVTAYQLALALTPLPIYALARHHALSPAVGVALGAWFLGNHFVGSLQLSNHFEVFYVLFALSTMALMKQNSPVAFWIIAVAALSVKEDCSLWLLAYAVWEYFLGGKELLVRRRALKLAVLCIAWGLMAAIIMFLASQGTDSSAARFADRMGGISVGTDTAMILLLLAVSSGGLVFFSWRAVLLLLVPLPVILGNFHITRNLLYYYSYPFLPFLAFATVAGTANLVELVKTRTSVNIRQFQFGIVIFVSTLGAAQFLLKTRTNDSYRVPHSVSPRDDMRRYVAADILPRDVPLALQYGLWGVVPWRNDTVFLSAEELKDRHYVMMDDHSPFSYGLDEFDRLAARLRQDLDTGRRSELFNRYGFVILSPASDLPTSGSLNQS